MGFVLHADRAAAGDLSKATVGTRAGSAIAVVMAAERYPGVPVTGDPIEGIDDAKPSNAYVYHAGTKRDRGALMTAGGRVLTVGAYAGSLAEARDVAYAEVARIRWRGEHHRADIGHRALASVAGAGGVARDEPAVRG